MHAPLLLCSHSPSPTFIHLRFLAAKKRERENEKEGKREGDRLSSNKKMKIKRGSKVSLENKKEKEKV